MTPEAKLKARLSESATIAVLRDMRGLGSLVVIQVKSIKSINNQIFIVLLPEAKILTKGCNNSINNISSPSIPSY